MPKGVRKQNAAVNPSEFQAPQYTPPDEDQLRRNAVAARALVKEALLNEDTYEKKGQISKEDYSHQQSRRTLRAALADVVNLVKKGDELKHIKIINVVATWETQIWNSSHGELTLYKEGIGEFEEEIMSWQTYGDDELDETTHQSGEVVFQERFWQDFDCSFIAEPPEDPYSHETERKNSETYLHDMFETLIDDIPATDNLQNLDIGRIAADYEEEAFQNAFDGNELDIKRYRALIDKHVEDFKLWGSNWRDIGDDHRTGREACLDTIGYGYFRTPQAMAVEQAAFEEKQATFDKQQAAFDEQLYELAGGYDVPDMDTKDQQHGDGFLNSSVVAKSEITTSDDFLDQEEPQACLSDIDNHRRSIRQDLRSCLGKTIACIPASDELSRIDVRQVAAAWESKTWNEMDGNLRLLQDHADALDNDLNDWTNLYWDEDGAREYDEPHTSYALFRQWFYINFGCDFLLPVTESAIEVAVEEHTFEPVHNYCVIDYDVDTAATCEADNEDFYGDDNIDGAAGGLSADFLETDEPILESPASPSLSQQGLGGSEDVGDEFMINEQNTPTDAFGAPASLSSSLHHPVVTGRTSPKLSAGEDDADDFDFYDTTAASSSAANFAPQTQPPYYVSQTVACGSISVEDHYRRETTSSNATYATPLTAKRREQEMLVDNVFQASFGDVDMGGTSVVPPAPFPVLCGSNNALPAFPKQLTGLDLPIVDCDMAEPQGNSKTASSADPQTQPLTSKSTAADSFAVFPVPSSAAIDARTSSCGNVVPTLAIDPFASFQVPGAVANEPRPKLFGSIAPTPVLKTFEWSPSHFVKAETKEVAALQESSQLPPLKEVVLLRFNLTDIPIQKMLSYAKPQLQFSFADTGDLGKFNVAPAVPQAVPQDTSPTTQPIEEHQAEPSPCSLAPANGASDDRDDEIDALTSAIESDLEHQSTEDVHSSDSSEVPWTDSSDSKLSDVSTSLSAAESKVYASMWQAGGSRQSSLEPSSSTQSTEEVDALIFTSTIEAVISEADVQLPDDVVVDMQQVDLVDDSVDNKDAKTNTGHRVGDDSSNTEETNGPIEEFVASTGHDKVIQEQQANTEFVHREHLSIQLVAPQATVNILPTASTAKPSLSFSPVVVTADLLPTMEAQITAPIVSPSHMDLLQKLGAINDSIAVLMRQQQELSMEIAKVLMNPGNTGIIPKQGMMGKEETASGKATSPEEQPRPEVVVNEDELHVAVEEGPISDKVEIVGGKDMVLSQDSSVPVPQNEATLEQLDHQVSASRVTDEFTVTKMVEKPDLEEEEEQNHLRKISDLMRQVKQHQDKWQTTLPANLPSAVLLTTDILVAKLQAIDTLHHRPYKKLEELIKQWEAFHHVIDAWKLLSQGEKSRLFDQHRRILSTYILNRTRYHNKIPHLRATRSAQKADMITEWEELLNGGNMLIEPSERELPALFDKIVASYRAFYKAALRLEIVAPDLFMVIMVGERPMNGFVHEELGRQHGRIREGANSLGREREVEGMSTDIWDEIEL
jgi:hypothetical protein